MIGCQRNGFIASDCGQKIRSFFKVNTAGVSAAGAPNRWLVILVVRNHESWCFRVVGIHKVNRRETCSRSTILDKKIYALKSSPRGEVRRKPPGPQKSSGLSDQMLRVKFVLPTESLRAESFSFFISWVLHKELKTRNIRSNMNRHDHVTKKKLGAIMRRRAFAVEPKAPRTEISLSHLPISGLWRGKRTPFLLPK